MNHDSTEQMVIKALQAGAPVDTEVEGDLADLRDRIESGNNAPMAIGDVKDGRSRRRLVLAAAAAFLLVGAAAAAVALRSGDDPVQVGTQPAGDGTGWYLPKGLGDEWQVEAVSTDFRGVEYTGADCPGDTRSWVDPGAAQTAYVKRFPASGPPEFLEDYSDEMESVDLGRGLSGVFVTTPSGPYLTFEHGDNRWLVTGFELPESDIIDMGRRIAAGSDPEPPRDSFDLLESYQTAGGASDYRDVHVVLRNQSTGARVAYVISPPGRGPDWGLMRSMPVPIELDGVVDKGVSAGDTEIAYVFRLPDADISSDSGSGFGADREVAAEEDVQAMLQSLRPATASEWASFVRSATDHRGASEAIAPTIDDLGKPAAVPTTTEPN